MARYISEEAFIAWAKERYCAECDNDNGGRCLTCFIDDAIDLVEDAPTADVVEVVRCKDCIYSKFNSSNETYKCDRRGYYTEGVDPDNDYCSKGERVDES